MSNVVSSPRTFRVAMVAAKPFPAPQGSQVLVDQTARLLEQRGHDVHLVVYGYGAYPTPEGRRIHRAANIPGARKTTAGPSWAKPMQDLTLARALREVLRSHAVDLVHAHNYEALAVALAVAGDLPVVYHAHNCLADELPRYFRWGRPVRAAARVLDRQLPRRANAVIALHPRLAGYLMASGCADEKISVIPPPLDPELVVPIRVGDALPPVVYAGNLDAYQNLDLLVEAMTRVRAARPAARLHLATADLRKFPAADRRIAVHNASMLRVVLQEDLIFVSPRVSWSGYPIKLINGMAAGKPMVACAGAAVGLVDRETGMIVPDNNVGAFAAAIIELMDQPALRRALGENAQQAAQRTHHPDVIGAAIERVYARVV